MPIDRPTTEELLNAVREHLINNLAPTLKGQPAFHLLVATNALGMIERTFAQGSDMDQAERERLQAILESDETDLITLNKEFVSQIKSGELDDSRETLLDHLRKTAHDKLTLANPNYMIHRD